MNGDKEKHLKTDPWGMRNLQLRKVEGTSVVACVTEASEDAGEPGKSSTIRGNVEYVSNRKMW